MSRIQSPTHLQNGSEEQRRQMAAQGHRESLLNPSLQKTQYFSHKNKHPPTVPKTDEGAESTRHFS